MTKAISANLKTHLAAGVTTVATCWRVVRKDAQEFFFTDHDVDVVYSGDTYEASSGMLPRSLQQNAGMAVDTQEIVAFLESDKIVEADIIAGLFDYATIDVFLINYVTVADGVLYLVKDFVLGELEISDNTFSAEARGKGQHLQQDILELYSHDCRADLGDSKCGVGLGSAFPDHSGAVTSVTDSHQFIDTTLIDSPSSADSSGGIDPIYEYGLLTWSAPGSGDSYTGSNAGLQMEVQSYNPGTGELVLFQAMPYTVEVGDGFTLTYGCDKSPVTCRDRFSNIVNFRGEPYLPGPDKLGEVHRWGADIVGFPNPFN